MKISYNWISEYIKGKLPRPEKLADLLTMHSFEVEEVKGVRLSTSRSDFIFDVDVLPNRAHDCLSHVGVARECAALLNSKFQIPCLAGRQVDSKPKEDKKLKVDDFMSVEVKNSELCSRYTARIMTDVKISSSPQWLKERLETLGQKSINNIVDVANYIMLETGQPLHIFDFDKVENINQNSKLKKIIIRKAKKKEQIVTLDGEKYELDNDILVIADSKNPIAIAGIKGGKKAEISNKTRTIILEGGNFNLNNIHKTSRKLNLQTEASLRFEHGLDPNLTLEAINKAVALIQKISKGKIAKGVFDIYPWKLKARKISLKISKINKLLGTEIPEKEVIRILNSLELKTKRISLISELINMAKSLINKPYKYGASTSQEAPELFDCSSFTRYLFRQIGKEIPRPSIEQIEVGREIEKKELKPGDLIFSKGFGKPHRNKKFPQGVGHVGLYIGNGRVINVPKKVGKVVTQNIDLFTKSNQWRGARRILEDENDQLLVSIPTRRLDIEIPEDLIEEIGRIYGYEKISPKPPLAILVSAKSNDLLKLKNRTKDILEGLGLTEVYNYSFVGDDDLKKLGLDSEDYLALENPLSSDLRYLRRDLITNLLKNIKKNFKYFNQARLFELGKVYIKSKAQNVKPKTEERMMLTGVLGRKEKEGKLFYEAKGVVDGLLNKLGITGQWYDNFQPTPEYTEKKLWQSSQSAEIKIDDKEIGLLGKINSEILTKTGIKGEVVVFNINFDFLLQLAREELIYRHPSKYPALIRDIAILVNFEDRVANVLNIINDVGGPLVRDVDLFDMYEGDKIPQGKKNLAFHIIYQSDQRTLKDKEVDEIQNRIIKEIKKRRGWEVRM